MPALALLFELADRAASNQFDSPEAEVSERFVSLEHAQQAAAWCEYLESHARRVYSCITTPQMRSAQELAEKIKRRKVSTTDSFTCRDVYLKGWSGLDSPEAVTLALNVLRDAGWVRELSSEPGPHGGRPSSRWQINPKVWNE